MLMSDWSSDVGSSDLGRTVSNFGKVDWKRSPRHLERDDGDRRFRFAFARRAPPFDGAGRCAPAPDDLQLLVSARQCGRIVAAGGDGALFCGARDRKRLV